MVYNLGFNVSGTSYDLTLSSLAECHVGCHQPSRRVLGRKFGLLLMI